MVHRERLVEEDLATHSQVLAFLQWVTETSKSETGTDNMVRLISVRYNDMPLGEAQIAGICRLFYLMRLHGIITSLYLKSLINITYSGLLTVTAAH